MRNHLLQKIKTFGAAILVVASLHTSAQITFGSLYKGTPGTGTDIGTVSEIIDGDLIKPITFPIAIAADAQGNTAVVYNGKVKIVRKNKSNNNIVIGPIKNTAGGMAAIAIDRSDEFVYYSSLNGPLFYLNKSIWKDDGTSKSYGHYTNLATGTITTDIQTIPFINSNDLVFANGSATRTVIGFGGIKGITFDAAGNMFYADATNHIVKKISIVETTIDGVYSAGDASLTLTSVAGLKVGDLVSGLNIPASTYIGSIISGAKMISLVGADGTTAQVMGGAGMQVASSSLTFVTGVTTILGTGGVLGQGTLPASAANTVLLNLTQTGQYCIGLVFDSAGNLFVGDIGNTRIIKVAANAGSVSGASSASLFDNTGLTFICGFAIDNADNLYVADRSRYAVFRYTPAGVKSTFAGTAGRKSVAGTTTSASTVISGVSALDIAKLEVGMYVRGTNINAGSYITSVSSTSFEMSSPAMATGTVGTIVVTSKDGFVTTATVTGDFEGPSGLVLIATGATTFDLILTEALGNNVRILSGGNTTLPVTLSKAFTAKLTASGTVDLKWETASEKDNSHFIIKHKTAANNQFSLLTSIPTKANTGAAYSAVDFNPANGTNYYELSQVDQDGTVTVLGLQAVKVSLENSAISVYPNPVVNAMFSVYAQDIVTATILVQITDITGKCVYEQSFNKTADGVYPISLNSKLNSGIYFISINHANHQKLVIN